MSAVSRHWADVRILVGAASGIVMLPWAAGADAEPQREPGRRVVEEIVVTAQKTEQSLRDVPISMSVLDGDFLEQQNIRDLSKVSRYVPNVSIDTNSFLIDARIRGFAAANETNKAFEQPVGLIVDGVAYGRPQYFQMGLFDLERIEVLRGPQGTLFGKNNSAGLFNLTTKNPTDELTGHVGLELGELDRRRFEGAIGGPLVPGLVNFRLAAVREEREGFIQNSAADVVAGANERLNGLERTAVRLKVGLPDLLGVDLLATFEAADIEFRSAGLELTWASEGTGALIRQFDPDADFTLNHRASVDRPELSTREIYTGVLGASYDLASWGIDAVAGYSTLNAADEIDVDFGPIPLAWDISEDSNPQMTFELRTTTPPFPGVFGLGELFGLPLGHTEATLGFFAQRRELGDSEFTIKLDPSLAAAYIASTMLPAEAVPPAMPSPNPEATSMFFDQTTDTLAGFGQVSWYVTPRWSLLAGARFSYETKEANWERVFTQGTGALFRVLLSHEEFTQSVERSESDFSPKLSLKFDWTEDVGFFATWAQGFRAAGFNEFASNAEPRFLTYDSEKAQSYELGTRMRLLGGTATVNAALFWMELTDFQIITDDPGTFASTVENAGKARARGLEADGIWLPTDWMTIIGSLGVNDSRFVEFPFGTCRQGEEDTDGDGNPRCDHSGKRLFRTPVWSASLAPNVDLPLVSLIRGSSLPLFSIAGLSLTAGLAGRFQSSYNASDALHPKLEQEPYLKFDASVGLADQGRGWNLRFVVENLTDELVAVRSFDGLFANSFFAELPEAPRLVFAELRWEF